MANQEKLTRYTIKRTAFVNSIIELHEEISKIDKSNEGYFLARCEGIQEVYDSFQTVQNQIIGLVDDESFVAHDAVRAKLDRCFYKIKAKKYELTSSLSASASTNAQQQVQQQQQQVAARASPHIDRLSVPNFDGDLKSWPTFLDIFNHLIHKNSNISDVEKFSHLKNALKGEPKNLISNLMLTDANYKVAYDALLKRYDSRRMLATTYYNEIVNAPEVKIPSARELRSLVDTFNANIAALKVLKFPTNSYDFLLFNMMLNKLPSDTRTKFELEHSSVDLPSYTDLINFLEKHCRALESVNFSSQSSVKQKQNNYKKSPQTQGYSNPNAHNNSTRTNYPASFHTGTNNCTNCPLCKKSHLLYRCQMFIDKSPHERLAFVKQNNLCQNCLRSPGHPLKYCQSTSYCKVCGHPHHTLCHISKGMISSATNHAPAPANALAQAPSSSPAPLAYQGSTQSSTNPNNQQINQTQFSACSSCQNQNQSTVLLSTATVDTLDAYGNFTKIRILLDTASMANFISESCISRLGLTRQKFSIPIEGINGMTSSKTNGITHCTIKPCNQPEPKFSFEALIVAKVSSDLPRIQVNPSEWTHVKNLPLADESYHTPGPIDLLAGAELVPYFLKAGRKFGNPGQPVALETVFGWVLQGKTQLTSSFLTIPSFHTWLDPSLDLILEKFWMVEQVYSPPKLLSLEEKKCEEIYQTTTRRNEAGRFVVTLPFKRGEPDLGDSYSQALRRFNYLETRLLKNPNMHKAYCDYMKESLENKHMELVPHQDYRTSKGYYIPHHPIIKPDSVSTKLRVVLDASAKASKGLSLNQTLLTGPKLQKDISALLLLFRLHPIVFICDLKRMYNQILIEPDQRDFQRILWRFAPDDPLQEYKLNTVTFGVSSSPYLALRTLQELANLYEPEYPRAAHVLKHTVFVDDVLGGGTDVISTLSLQRELIQLLKLGCFELRKWASNHPAILASVPSDHTLGSLSFDKEGPTFIKVLGVQWTPTSDSFSFSCTPPDAKCTKRNVLSLAAKMYDPTGFVSPVVFFAKHIMQQLWIANLDWDEDPSQEIITKWSRFKGELHILSNVSIPRHMVPSNYRRLEFHIFADASLNGYCSCAYFRLELANQAIQTFLVCSKSRVAPIKQVLTIPKLELCAAVLAANLAAFVKETYSNVVIFDEIYAWSDSQVTLHWLSSSAHRWRTFIANRVSHVQEIIPSSCWKYVPSADNPADVGSRGCMPSDLLNHPLWWNGPPWLAKPRSEWPEQPIIEGASFPEALLEEKPLVLNVVIEQNIIDTLLQKHSSLGKIQRLIAYLHRWLYNHKNPDNKSKENLPTPQEMQNALLLVTKHVQSQVFSEILKLIVQNKLLPKPVRKLTPFIDKQGLLRVGGRIKRTELLSFSAKHPLLLPKSHRFTDLIIESIHQKYLHPGFKTLYYLIVQQFWILSPRQAIFRCLSKCVRCFRAKPKSYNPIMADLPLFRVSRLKCFTHVTLDYAGWFRISSGKHRGCKVTKGYVAIFCCGASRALHLELASDLSAEAFLAAFHRFVARRGRVSDVYSDQGTNFVGCKNILSEYSKYSADCLSINWHMNPPGAPHFNGLAEAGVRSIKTHLYRVIGEQTMTYEEFYTFLTQVEALLNSRPLTPASSDPNDLNPITPGHFLTMEALNTLPDPDLSHLKINQLNRWQLVQKMHADFWKRWQCEYLHSLQQRSKWTEPTKNIELNTLVLIKNEQTPPRQWALGRVIEVHPGQDGVIRVVTLKTKSGVMRRPVVKVCPLPTAD